LFAEAMDIVRKQQKSKLRADPSEKDLPDTTFITASAEAVARAADVVMDQVLSHILQYAEYGVVGNHSE